MADSRREQAMKNLKTVLEGITTDNGYDLTVRNVLRLGISVDQIQGLPSIVVAEAPEDHDDETFGPNDTAKVTNRLRVDLDCWIEKNNATHEDLNQFLANVQKAVMADRTLSGIVHDIRLVTNEHLLNEQIKPYAGVSQTIELRYRHFSADPFNC